MAKILQFLCLVGVIPFTQQREECQLSCSVKGKRIIPCNVTTIGNDICQVLVTEESVFHTDNKSLAPRARDLKIKARYSYKGTKLQVLGEISWKLTSGKGILSTKGFLIQTTLLYRRGEIKTEYFLIEPNGRFTHNNKRSKFTLSCLDLEDAFFVEISIWSLPNRISEKSIPKTQVIIDTQMHCLTSLVDVGNGIRAEFGPLDKSSTTTSATVGPCACSLFNNSQISYHKQRLAINVCPLSSTNVLIVVLKKNGKTITEKWLNQIICNVSIQVKRPANYTLIIKRKCYSGILKDCKNVQFAVKNGNQVYESYVNQTEAIVAAVVGAIAGVVCLSILLLMSVKFRMLAAKDKTHQSPLNNNLEVKFNSLEHRNIPNILLIEYQQTDQYRTQIIRHFTDILENYSILVFNFWDNIFGNKKADNIFDWIQARTGDCDHFVFIMSKEMCELLKEVSSLSKGKERNDYKDHIIKLLIYTLTLLRQHNEEGKHCHIVSFGDNFWKEDGFHNVSDWCVGFRTLNIHELVDVSRTNGVLTNISINMESWSNLIRKISSSKHEAKSTDPDMYHNFLTSVIKAARTTEENVHV